MIARFRRIQWFNILLIVLITIVSEYIIELLLFGHFLGRGYAFVSVVLHILYYLTIPFIIVASELWKRRGKKSVQYLVLIAPTILHILLHVFPFFHLLDYKVPDDEIQSDYTIEENHGNDERHHDIDWYWYVFAILFIWLQVWIIETLLHRLPLDHKPSTCDNDCDH